jgi:hypothetical protein
MKFNKNCIESVKHVLDNSDIYSIDNFSYKLTQYDVGITKSTDTEDIVFQLRKKWLFGYYGLYTNIQKYTNASDRFIERAYNSDLSSTLRQKMNIVSEMMDANFTSSMPVHISVAIKENVPQNKSVIIDNINGYDKEEIDLIIHPGQTRAQSAVFCKRDLSNVLFYIPKKYKERISLVNFNNITKIDTIDKLTQVYNVLPGVTDDLRDIELNINAYEGTYTEYDIIHKTKSHTHNCSEIVPLAKVYYMENIKKDPIVSVHPSDIYIDNSFRSFNYFMDKVHNNRVNVYTNCKPSVLGCYLQSITKKLLQYASINEELENNESKVKTEYSFESFLLQAKDLLGKPFREEFNSIVKKISLFHKHLNELKESKIKPYASPNIIRIEKIDNKEIVKLNLYSGFCIYIDKSLKDNLYRNHYELLFFTNWDVAITRSEDNKIAIYNCEHEYWKTGNNYKEWILTKEMYYE